MASVLLKNSRRLLRSAPIAAPREPYFLQCVCKLSAVFSPEKSRNARCADRASAIVATSRAGALQRAHVALARARSASRERSFGSEVLIHRGCRALRRARCCPNCDFRVPVARRSPAQTIEQRPLRRIATLNQSDNALWPPCAGRARSHALHWQAST